MIEISTIPLRSDISSFREAQGYRCARHSLSRVRSSRFHYMGGDAEERIGNAGNDVAMSFACL